AGKRAKTPARAIAAHGIASFLGSCETKPPVIATGRRGLQDKACRHRLDATVARCQKPGPRRYADQTGHSGGVRRSGRQARAALCTAGTQNAAAANSGHARAKAVAALADENTRLIGAFH